MPGKPISKVGLNRKIDLKRTGGGLLPDGAYPLRVDTVEVKESTKSEHPYINIKFLVTRNGQPTGSIVWDIISFSPAARFKFDQILDAMNAPEDGEVSVSWFKGKSVYANLVTETYRGKSSNKIGQYITAEVYAQQLEAGIDSDDEDDDDDDDDDELSDEEDGDEEEEEEEEEEVAPPPVAKTAAKTKAATKAAPAPAKKTAAKKKPVVDDDDDEDDDSVPF